MKYAEIDIALQEVPGEISICFSISGCKIKCSGCHSPYLWSEQFGKELTEELFISTLTKYKNFASCVLFMGGEWCKDELLELLKISKKMGYNTCLYSGQDNICESLKAQLTWLKTGSWKEERGGLNCKTTNQQFIEVKTNKNLNHIFIKN